MHMREKSSPMEKLTKFIMSHISLCSQKCSTNITFACDTIYLITWAKQKGMWANKYCPFAEGMLAEIVI